MAARRSLTWDQSGPGQDGRGFRHPQGLVDDAAQVRQVIRSCPPPVVVVGWSYGGTVIGVAAAGEATVSRLIYVASVPMDVSVHAGDISWLENHPHIIVRPDGTNVLDNDWWLNEEKGASFSAEVAEHLRRHPGGPLRRA